MTDMVNHPSHYNSHPSGIEAIEIVRYMDFNTGNAVKYLWRLGHKDNELQELKKVAWYIKDELDQYPRRGFFSKFIRYIAKKFSPNSKLDMQMTCKDMKNRDVARAICLIFRSEFGYGFTVESDLGYAQRIIDAQIDLIMRKSK